MQNANTTRLETTAHLHFAFCTLHFAFRITHLLVRSAAMSGSLHDRRRFLQFLAASPLFAHAWAQQPALTLESASDAITLMDFEEAARRVLSPALWGYMISGVADALTLRRNRDGFGRCQLRPRRLVDVSTPDLRVDIFGATWETPPFLCPVGGQRMFHRDGELAVARAANAKNTVQILSTATSTSVEDVAKTLNTPPWYQLYMPTTWDGTERLIRRVEAAGCTVLVWTVDLLGGRNMETAERFRRADTRDCTACHSTARGGRALDQLTMLSGIPGGMNPPAADWSYVDRLRKLTRMRLVLKGVETREDARLARERGGGALIVTNHGGRERRPGRRP